jgi:hypothetical protein
MATLFCGERTKPIHRVTVRSIVPWHTTPILLRVAP